MPVGPVRCRLSFIKPAVMLVALLLVAISVAPARAADTTVAAAPQQEQAASLADIVLTIREDVARLRGLEFKRDVPVRVMAADDIRAHMLKRMEKFYEPQQLAEEQLAYQLLGLVPEGMDVLETLIAAMREQAGGFYDPDSGAFYILDDVTPELIPMIVAHELTHALEDQHFDLDGRAAAAFDDEDRAVAVSAVHEGSATLLMTVYMTQRLAAGKMDMQAFLAQAEEQAKGTEALKRLPEVFQRQLIGPYVLGASFLARGNVIGALSSGFPRADVDRAYADPPLSSEQLLHPEKYWNEEARDLPQEVDTGAAGVLLGTAWRTTEQGRLGELVLGTLVGAASPVDSPSAMDGAAWTHPAVVGWGGDRWELWRGEDAALVLLATVWDSELDAKEFAQAIEGRAGFAARLAGRRVAIVAGDAGERGAALLDAMLEPRPLPEVVEPATSR